MDNNLNLHDFVVERPMMESMLGSSGEGLKFDFNDQQPVFSNASQADLEKELREILEENEKPETQLENTTSTKKLDEKLTALQKKVESALCVISQNPNALRYVSESLDEIERAEDCLERSFRQSFTLDHSLNYVTAPTSLTRTRDTSLIIDKANTSLKNSEMIKKSVIPTHQSSIKETGDSKMTAKTTPTSDGTKTEIEGTGAGSKSLEFTSGPDEPFEFCRTWLRSNFDWERYRLGKIAKRTSLNYIEQQIRAYLELQQGNIHNQAINTESKKERNHDKALLPAEHYGIKDEYKGARDSLDKEQLMLAEVKQDRLKLELPVNHEKPKEKSLEKSSQEMQWLKDMCKKLKKRLEITQTACVSSFVLLTEHSIELTKKVEDVSAENEALRIEKEDWIREKKAFEAEHALLIKEIITLKDIRNQELS